MPKTALAASYDVNKDGLVDRYEARLFLARRTGGPAFSIGGDRPAVVAMGRASSRTSVSPAWILLDENKDGTLSAKEIKAANGKLEGRDNNGDQALTLTELLGAGGAGGDVNVLRLAQAVSGGESGPNETVFMLGPTIDAKAIQSALAKRFADAITVDRQERRRHTPLLADVLDKLDKNKDFALDEREVRELNRITPHLALKAVFAKDSKKPTVTVVSLADELSKREDILTKTSSGYSLDVYGARLNMSPPSSKTSVMIRIAGLASGSFEQLDTDKSGVLEKTEVVGDAAGQFGRVNRNRFENWDVNSDGRVTKEEHAAFVKRRRTPADSRVSLNSKPVGHRLFTALDANGDNQLGLREMRTAAARLAKLDRNRDGNVSQTEVPGSVDLDLSLGQSGAGGVLMLSGMDDDKLTPRPASTKGPDWFKRMDRNSDGDVTLKEFLGEAEQFRKIDTNNDSFIDANEAAAFDKKE